MLTFIFFDTNADLIKEYKKIIKSKKINILFVIKDINSLLVNRFDAIISPGNSLCNMNGGIDKVYKKIFPGIEQSLIKLCNSLQLAKSGIGYYIPVGRNIKVPVDHKSCKYIIYAPTMFTPKDINDTNNIYIAFYGILENYYAENIIIVCPGLGTGIGGMSPFESATQIMSAIDDYCYNNPIK